MVHTVRPGLIGGDIGAVGKSHVDAVEGDDDVRGVVHLLERGDEARLLTDSPRERLVGDPVT